MKTIELTEEQNSSEHEEADEMELIHTHRKSESNRYARQFTRRMEESRVMDVYDVLNAFNPPLEQVRHAIKKLLNPGGRNGGKTMLKDLKEARWSIDEAIKELDK